MSWIASAHEPRTRNNVPAPRSDQGLIGQSDSNDPVTYDRINAVALEDEDAGRCRITKSSPTLAASRTRWPSICLPISPGDLSSRPIPVLSRTSASRTSRPVRTQLSSCRTTRSYANGASSGISSVKAAPDSVIRASTSATSTPAADRSGQPVAAPAVTGPFGLLRERIDARRGPAAPGDESQPA